jgi:hypothetical protein
LAGEGLDQRSGPWLRVHFDSLVKARQPIQQYRTSAEIGRHFETVDATADCGSEQSGGTGQPSANIEHAIFGQNLRQRQQLAGSADSAGVEMVKRPPIPSAAAVARDSIRPRGQPPGFAPRYHQQNSVLPD